MSQYLDESCRNHFDEVKSILDACGIPYVVNDRLVRGLDYYTRTAFEFTHGALGSQNAILGGGRYDGLSEAIGGPKAPGIGFAIGEDRLVMSIPESTDSILKKPDAYIAPMGPGMNKEAARLARELRQHDLVIELGDEAFRLKKSLETASKIAARFAIIIGENEVTNGQFAVKDLNKGEQVSLSRDELVRYLQDHR
jgi:histidyl-tRNA synthetase